jgi:TatD DNase family protein
MDLIDSHTHLYLPEFKSDIKSVIQNAVSSGITKMILPNIDSDSYFSMIEVCKNNTGKCFPTIGLHPTSVKSDYKEQIGFIINNFSAEKFIASGEVGIDLYWDKTFFKEQEDALSVQIDLALTSNLPLIIHCRDSFNEIINILNKKNTSSYKGVFHSFSGTAEQAKIIMDMGFMIGINGIITYKNSILPDTLKVIGLEKILLETDSPYLTPVPYRGKRNESSYLIYIARKISEILNLSLEEVANKTTINAKHLFSLEN